MPIGTITRHRQRSGIPLAIGTVIRSHPKAVIPTRIGWITTHGQRLGIQPSAKSI